MTEQICENCGYTEPWCNQIGCKKFTPQLILGENKPKNHSPQVDLNDVLKLVRETLNFSNSKERLIEKLKALHSQEVDVRRQKEDNNSSPDTQNHKKGCGMMFKSKGRGKYDTCGELDYLCPECQEKEK